MSSPSKPQTLGGLFATSSSETSDAVALLAPGRLPLTYGRLAQQVKEVVACLRFRDIGRNDRVAVVLPNGPDLATAFVSVASSATFAPLSNTLPADAYAFFLEDLQAKALLLPSDEDSPARSAAVDLGIPVFDVTVGSEAGAFSLSGPAPMADLQSAEGQADDVALVMYTSGTTARPKLVPLTQANLLASARNHCATLALDAQDRCLNFMPLNHMHGLVSAVLSSLWAGGSVCCLPGFDAEKFFDWLATYRPSWYTASPAFHQAVLAGVTDRSEAISQHSLRFIRSAAAPLPRGVAEQLEQTFGIPVIESYGMTETVAQICSNPLPPRRRVFGSVGPAAGPEVAVMGAGGALLTPGQTGEIVIRGDNVTAGYADNPLANEAAFADGWFQSGDLGHQDEDGYFYITGRKKEIINRGGEMVSPREIDDVLLEHPAVAEAVAFAVPHATLGEDIAAAVVLRDQAVLEEQELRDFAFARLPEFKVPGQIVFVTELPKSETGKLQRRGLHEKLKGRMRQGFVAPRNELEEVIASMWEDLLQIDNVGVHDNFFTRGGDSISATQLTSRLNDKYDVKIPVPLLFQLPTISQLAAGLQEIKDAGSGDTTCSAVIEPIRPIRGENVEESSTCGVLEWSRRAGAQGSRPQNRLSFSIYFFSADGSTTSGDKYRMLKECSRFADQNGFSAVWIPERHFSSFGGLYPSPAVLGAAIAAETERIQIRAGSVVVPLQDPLRVAEEWSVVDNLSGGRVAIACASGWHPNDFVLAPANYPDRRRIMMDRIKTIQRLWKGESIRRANGLGEEVEVGILPKPIQPTLPIWLAAHSDETFVKAGEIGANLVTNIWKANLDDVSRQIEMYRKSWNRHGEPGARGIVTLMIHTFLGESNESVIEQLKSAYGEYLFTFLQLRDVEAAGSRKDFDLSDNERANLVAEATRQLYESRGLVGTPDRCLSILESIRSCDVDEVACLIDFGVDPDTVMQSLQRLAGLKSRFDAGR